MWIDSSYLILSTFIITLNDTGHTIVKLPKIVDWYNHWYKNWLSTIIKSCLNGLWLRWHQEEFRVIKFLCGEMTWEILNPRVDTADVTKAVNGTKVWFMCLLRLIYERFKCIIMGRPHKLSLPVSDVGWSSPPMNDSFTEWCHQGVGRSHHVTTSVCVCVCVNEAVSDVIICLLCHNGLDLNWHYTNTRTYF